MRSWSRKYSNKKFMASSPSFRTSQRKLVRFVGRNSANRIILKHKGRFVY